MGRAHEKFDTSISIEMFDSKYNLTNSSNLTEENLLAFTEESRIEAIVYSILFLLASAGNIPVFISLMRGRRRRSRIQEMILHLTIADLIVTLVMIPLEICWRITVEWIAGDALCRIMLFFRAFGPYLSSMILVCISIDRFTAIVYPLRVNVAQKRVRCMLRCAWVGSFVCSIPQSIIFHVERHPVQTDFAQCVSFNFFRAEYQKVLYNIFCVIALYGGPLSVIVYCYCRVLWAIRTRSKMTNNVPYSNCLETTRRCTLRLSDTSHIEKTRSRTLKMTLLIVFSFICCWTPYVIIDLWYLFDSTSAENLDTRIQSSLFMFAVFNSCINPLVYGSYIVNFRSVLWNLCYCLIKSDNLSVVTPSSKIDGKKIFTISRNAVDSSPDGLPAQGEVYHELKQATPVRRPVNRREALVVDDHLVFNSCDSPKCNYCRSSTSST